MAELDGMRVAVLAADGVEERDLREALKALEEAGARTQIVGLHTGRIQSYRGDEPGETFTVDIRVAFARPSHYHALVIPGGERSAQVLRGREEVATFLRGIAMEGKPVAAIGPGLGLLVPAGLAESMTLTSTPGLRRELERAGATWVDDEVVVDGNLVSSRTSEDLEAFCREMRTVFRGVAPEVAAPPPPGA